MRSFYPPNVNPAQHLYNYWLNLIESQGEIRPEAGRYDNRWMSNWPIVAYGARRCGVTVHSFDANARPILAYGCWYNGNGFYRGMLLNADGDFQLLNTHGEQHERISRHTFLTYGYYGGQYVWAVSPLHGSHSIDPKDWQTRTPYLRERIIRPHFVWKQRPDGWLKLEQGAHGYGIVPVDESTRFGYKVLEDAARTERAYLRWQRASGGVTRPAVLRDGKTTLRNDAAVLHIAALLDVSQPAKAVRMSKTREVLV